MLAQVANELDASYFRGRAGRLQRWMELAQEAQKELEIEAPFPEKLTCSEFMTVYHFSFFSDCLLWYGFFMFLLHLHAYKMHMFNILGWCVPFCRVFRHG